MRPNQRFYRTLLVSSLLVVSTAMAFRSPVHATEEPTVTIDPADGSWVPPDYPLTLTVSPWPASGHLAVLIGGSDVTDLFRRDSNRLVYRPGLLPLPRGESEVLIYLIGSTGDWDELARRPLKVLQPAGFESLSVRPTVDIELQGAHDPEGGEDQTGQTETKASGQARIEVAATRRQWSYGFDLATLGASEKEEALRFSSEGEGAPQFDLASYRTVISRGEGRLELGHVSVGQQRQLLEGFSSRGLSVSVPIGSRVSLGASSLNGTQIVGWDNILGLSESNHQVHTASLGVELLPRPGAVQVSGAWLDASILPLSGFDQGNLQDREESSGWGLSVQGSTPGARFTLRGGFSRSAFTNPQDTLLEQGSDLVEVVEETRDARYAEIDLSLLRTTTSRRQLGVALDLLLKHQRVDPLYRSIGAFVASDTEENGVDLRATVGDFTAQVGHTRSHDNLDDIPSILETKTRQDRGAVFLPLARAAQGDSGKERRWLPALSYTYGRTHQFSDTLPLNGGFSPSHLPDQESLSHVLSLDWQGNRWRLNVSGSRSDQDNRQPERENKNFAARTVGLNSSWSLHATLDLAISLGEEESENIASRETDTTLRTALNLSWRPRPSQSVELIASRSDADSSPRLRESLSRDLSLQWSWQFARSRGATEAGHGFNSRFHLLYSRQDFEARDLAFGLSQDTDRWTVSGGLSISLF